MKVLFLSSYAHLVLSGSKDRVSGGAELQVALLSRELAKRGIDCVVVGGDVGQSDGAVFDGVSTRNGGRFQTGGLVDLVFALPRIAKILAEERPTHVYVLGWTTWLWILLKMRRFFGYQLGFICGLDTEVNGEFRRENPVRGALFESGVAGCDIRLAMTNYQAACFEKNGQSCGMYRNLILPRSTPQSAEKSIDLLWVARCQPIKRPHLFLDLVERLPHLRCRMICPCEDQQLWATVAARATTVPNLEFHEKVPYHQIQEVYDSANIFVNTSTFEGWPNSFIQSGLGHTALASLDVNPDQLFDLYELGAFANGDTSRFESQITTLISDPARLAHTQAECARFVHELHDNQSNVNAFLEYQSRVTSEKSRGDAEAETE
ncbi:MAG: glycosyltransferase [Chthoniobacterales bacterium]